MSPRWPQDGPRWPKMAPKKRIKKGPKLYFWRQAFGPFSGFFFLKGRCLSGACLGPKMAPRWPKDGPRCPQDCPQDSTRSPQDGSRWLHDMMGEGGLTEHCGSLRRSDQDGSLTKLVLTLAACAQNISGKNAHLQHLVPLYHMSILISRVNRLSSRS